MNLTGKTSNFWVEDYVAVTKFMNEKKQKKKLSLQETEEHTPLIYYQKLLKDEAL